MVQAIENRSRLHGRVREIVAGAPAPGFNLVRVQVDRADPEPGWRHLLEGSAGTSVDVIAPESAIGGLNVGDAFVGGVTLVRSGLVRLSPDAQASTRP